MRQMPAQIIAICGLKRSGKDTIADYLVSNYGYTKIKLADPIKHVVKHLFGFTSDQVGETDEKDIIDQKWNITPRQAMQFFGTEMMQYKIQELLPNIGRKFWINSLLSNIEDNKKYVISDLRFLHEYTELLKHDAYIIKVIRPMKSTQIDTHCSEEEYERIPENLLLNNDAEIDQLLIKLNNALSAK